MDLFTQLILLILIGIIGGLVAKRLNMPVSIGYILSSAIFINIFPLDESQTGNINELADIGVTLLMFSIGIEFSIDKLFNVKKYAVLGGILQILLTILFGYLIFPLLEFDPYSSFFLGAVFSFSSTAIVAQIIEDRGILNDFSSDITIGWLIVQDIAVVFLIMVLSNFAPINAGSSELFDTILKSFILIAGSLVIGRKVLPRILKSIALVGNKELVVISAFGFSLAFALVAEKLGVSSTLGAFLAGLMISESVLNHEIITEINPLQAIFSLIFFTSLGSLFSLSYVFSHLAVIILLVIIVIIIKFVIVLILNLILKLHFKTAFEIALNLAQVGEFAFLIAQIGSNNGWITNEVGNIVSSVTLISMILAPILIQNTDRIYHFTGNLLKKYNGHLYRLLYSKNETAEVIDKELKNHIIICGYGRVGKYVALALKRLRQKYIVIEMNKIEELEGFQKDLPFIVGDSTNSDILKDAGIEKAKILIITLPKDVDAGEIIRVSKIMNPDIQIIIRKHHASKDIDETDLFAVIEPEFEATIKMLEKLLHLMRKKDKSVLRWVRDQKKALQ